jgi:hypothetical protein
VILSTPHIEDLTLWGGPCPVHLVQKIRLNRGEINCMLSLHPPGAIDSITSGTESPCTESPCYQSLCTYAKAIIFLGLSSGPARKRNRVSESVHLVQDSSFEVRRDCLEEVDERPEAISWEPVSKSFTKSDRVDAGSGSIPGRCQRLLRACSSDYVWNFENRGSCRQSRPNFSHEE